VTWASGFAIRDLSHLFGDDKNRGPALIDLTEMYKDYGLPPPDASRAASPSQ
jgi:nitrate reductase assembly molybdenum cofactor insertion protein NarJ